MREETFTRYYADDGSVFDTREECESYEKNTEVNLKKVLSDMCLNMDNMAPPFYRRNSSIKDTLPLLDNRKFIRYEWFVLKTPEDYCRLEEAIPKNSKLTRNLKEPDTYPEVIAIESAMVFSLKSNQNKYKYTGRYAYMHHEKEKIRKRFNIIDEALDKYMYMNGEGN